MPAPPHAPRPTALETALIRELWPLGGSCTALAVLPLPGASALPQRVRACQCLANRGWLTYNWAIAQFGLTLAGKTLLGLDLSVWPVTPDELWILRSCRGGRIGPEQIHRRVATVDRQRLLERLAQQKLIVVYGQAIVALALTPVGAAQGPLLLSPTRPAAGPRR
jgi:hypothetical protein